MKKAVIILAAAAFLALAALCVYIYVKPADSGSHTAVITINGEEYRRIDLSSEPDGEFIISTEYGTNTIAVKDHTIRVIEASCPDKICVSHGELTSDLLPIVCLPNKLIITLA